MKKNRIYPVIGVMAQAVAAFILLFVCMAYLSPGEEVVEKDFTLKACERETIEFTVTEAGYIHAVAEWSPPKAELSLILFRPGQMNYAERVDDKSPAKLYYEVTADDTVKGTDWKLKVVNMTNETVVGHVRLAFPGKVDSLVQ